MVGNVATPALPRSNQTRPAHPDSSYRLRSLIAGALATHLASKNIVH